MAELEEKIGLQIDYSKVQKAMDNVLQKYDEFVKSMEDLKNAEITYTANLPYTEKHPWWKFWKRK